MQISQTIKQRQSQSVTLQTMQSRQLLVLPLPQLQSFLSKAVLDNPFLEVRQVVDIPCGRMLSDEWTSTERERDLPLYRDPAVTEQRTLSEMLRLQISLLHLPECTVRQLRFLIELLDRNGYLRESDEELAGLLGIDAGRVAALRNILQSLSPRGLGARDLAECLLLQVGEDAPDRMLLREVIASGLPALGARRYRELAARCHVSVERIRAVAKQIQSMDPKPGSAYEACQTPEYIYPDAKVRRCGDRLELQVKGSPSAMLQFDSAYLEGTEDRDAKAFLREKRGEALTLIHSLEMRYHAIERLLDYLMAEQGEFFVKGPRFLHPLSMKTAAEALNVSPSTITRCVQGKYIEAPWGIVPIRRLFSTAAGGAAVCPEHIQAWLTQWIRQEDPAAPLSDELLAGQLKELGIDISRRTVTKYREQLGIAGQRERRRCSREEGGIL